ncbi:MAG TPA: hypothetical protein VM012_10780 [Flavitalea sp.]|nr:hypothetical protein [Flavitalea sp.]
MNSFKRYLGILWMVLGPVLFYLLVHSAVVNIDLSGKSDINKPLPWIIIMIVFAPVAAGLSIFGYYAWKGEYDIAN